MTQLSTNRSAPDIRVNTVADLEEARGLADEWGELVECACDREPFLTPEWYLSWWEAFGRDEMLLLTAWSNRQLIGVGPFRISTERQMGRERQVLRLWANAFSNRANVVLHEDFADEAAAALTDALLDPGVRWDVAQLKPVHQDATAIDLLTRELTSRDVPWGMREDQRSPYLPLPDSWDELSDRLDGKFRRSLGYDKRKAHEKAEITYEFGGDAPEDVEPAFEIAEHTWQYEAGSGIAARNDIERFYRTLAQAAARKGWLWIAYLVADGQAVSYELNLKFQNRLYDLKRGYHADYRHLGPGTVLGQEVIRRAIDEEIDQYDFLGAAERYKTRWTERVRRIGTLWIFRRGLMPRLTYLAYFRLRPLIQDRAPWLLRLKRRLTDASDSDGDS